MCERGEEARRPRLPGHALRTRRALAPLHAEPPPGGPIVWSTPAAAKGSRAQCNPRCRHPPGSLTRGWPVGSPPRGGRHPSRGIPQETSWSRFLRLEGRTHVLRDHFPVRKMSTPCLEPRVLKPTWVLCRFHTGACLEKGLRPRCHGDTAQSRSQDLSPGYSASAY